MKENPDELKQQVKTRLRKIEGQVRGIIRMVDEGKDCQDILIQVKAVRKAFNSVNSVILKRYISTCYEEMTGDDSADTKRERLEEVVKVMTDFMG